MACHTPLQTTHLKRRSSSHRPSLFQIACTQCGSTGCPSSIHVTADKFAGGEHGILSEKRHLKTNYLSKSNVLSS